MLKLFFFVLSLGSMSMLANGQVESPDLLGRWEVLRYTEQAVPVDKKAAALPQAQKVYEHIRKARAAYWYGYAQYENLNRRESRTFEAWQQRDSTIEVTRIAKAIAMPYYAVFFADSTLALYNKDSISQLVAFPEAYRYVFTPQTSSIDIIVRNADRVRWQAQVLLLTDNRLILFLPEEAELVELQKTAYIFPE